MVVATLGWVAIVRGCQATQSIARYDDYQTAAIASYQVLILDPQIFEITLFLISFNLLKNITFSHFFPFIIRKTSKELARELIKEKRLLHKERFKI